MSDVLRTAAVTGGWIVVQGAIGLLGLRGRRPYKALLIVIHIIVFIFVAAGWGYTVSGLSAAAGNHIGSWIAEIVMGLAVVSQLLFGALLTAGRKIPAPKVPVGAHLIGGAAALTASVAGVICILSGV